MKEDPFDLNRFVVAQAPMFETALAELRDGRKRSHWMWFIFPQLRGLGRSPIAQLYGIESLEEARAYLAHPLLGPRLELATQAVSTRSGPSLSQIFGSPDDLKFHSSMTLFTIASSIENSAFQAALDHWFGGGLDEASVTLLNRARSAFDGT